MAEYQRLGDKLPPGFRLICSTISFLTFSYLISSSADPLMEKFYQIFLLQFLIAIAFAIDYFHSKEYKGMATAISKAITYPLVSAVPFLIIGPEAFPVVVLLSILTVVAYLEFARRRVYFYSKHLKSFPKEIDVFIVRRVWLIELAFMLLGVGLVIANS